MGKRVFSSDITQEVTFPAKRVKILCYCQNMMTTNTDQSRENKDVAH